MRFPKTILPFLWLGLAAGPLIAQDSVSKTGCLPGDGETPWLDASGPNGSEQCDAYVVDMAPFISSWGNIYGIAPVLKSSQTTAQFFGSLIGAQSLSRRQKTGVPFASSTYSSWVASPGTGVNNDPAINDPGTPLDMSSALGHQFGVALSENSDLGGASYNGIVGALINQDPTNPGRLFVTRRVAAINTCDNLSDLSQMGFGTVDENGYLFFRADNFGSFDSVSCGLSMLQANNIFRIDMAARNCASRNVISFESLPPGGGQTDTGATDPTLPLYGATLNTPSMMPSTVTGGVPIYLGTDFNGNFVRGTDLTGIALDQSHWAPGVTDHRGNVSYSTRNYAFLGSTHGTAAILAKDGDDSTEILNLFGLDSNANVTGKQGFPLPAVITDNATGFVNPGLDNEFGHYFSQVAFRGGNGQIALGRDQQGRLIAAAAVDHPGPAFAGNTDQYIAVARIDPVTGAAEWTMAGYHTAAGGGSGKPILDGPGGSVIGQQIDLSQLSGNAVPGVSAPMIDGVGNIYFIAAVEIFDPLGGPSDTGTGLIRAVYDPAAFKYELELMFDTGTVISGLNSGRNYMITFMQISDSNSIGSGGAWSGNINEMAHLGQDPSGLSTQNPASLGGLAISAEIVYDFNGDAQFSQCTGGGGDPLSPDQDYNVVLYIGSLDAGTDLDGNGQADESQMLSGDGTSVSLSAGGTVNLELRAGLELGGDNFLILGSLLGTVPGFSLFGFHVPLNPDTYFLIRLNSPGALMSPSGMGVLDGQGRASVGFVVPPAFFPTLAGVTVNHAYGTFDFLVPGLGTGVSNPWPIQFLP